MVEVGLLVVVGVKEIDVEINLFAVGDVVDGKSVAKGCPLGDLGEPGQQLWGSRRLGKRKGQEGERGSNRDWIHVIWTFLDALASLRPIMKSD